VNRTVLVLLAVVAITAAPARAQDPLPAPPRMPPPNDTVPWVLENPPQLRMGGPRVCAGGDVTLGTNLDTGWVHTASARLGRRVAALPSPDSLLAPLRPLLIDADIVLLNVEGAIGEGPPARRKCAPGSTSCFAFRSPIAAAAALRGVAPEARVVGNVANNHARDAGDPGWRATARHLRDADVHVTGMDTVPELVALPSGDTVAFLGFSAWAGPSVSDLAAVRRHVRRAAERHRYVVVTFHAGAEGSRATRTPNAVEVAFGENRGNSVAFAREAAESGADVIFGHGPHVMRGAQWIGDALVFYSLGNLVTYGPFTFSEPLNRGALACATLHPDGGVLAAELRSTRQRAPGIVSADSAHTAATLVDQLSRLDFPSGAPVIQAGGVIERPSGGEPSARPTHTAPRPHDARPRRRNDP
jgi:hypothetical protein